MKREVNKRSLLKVGVVIFDLIGLIGCAMISWKAALWYFGFAFVGALLQYAYEKMEDKLIHISSTVPIEPQPQPQPTKEEVVEVTKVHARPTKKSSKKVKKSTVKE
jgi:hypothetical protein